MNTTVQTKPKATLPDPDINEVSKPYWDALKKGKLTFQHCRKCGNNWLPARGECPKLISWVVFHRAFHPAFEDRLPYNVAVVELAEGPRMITNIVIEDAEKLVIDQPLTFMPAEEQGHGIARFRPV